MPTTIKRRQPTNGSANSASSRADTAAIAAGTGMSEPLSPSSLDSLHMRTPRMDPDALDEHEGVDEVEMSLLGRPKTNRALEEAGAGAAAEEVKVKAPLSARDKRAMALLIVLYLIQGVPLGLALGSLPFLIQDKVSYSQQATFTLCQYPYSLKLLWSPIVDSVFFPSIGRRKSWIIPMQVIIGTLMFWISFNVEALLVHASENLYTLTFIFTSLVFVSATQDIAVDGWALTLLSQENVSYASTCQTVGLTTGYFASFTVFLALNSSEFTAKWGLPRLTLSTYLQTWGVLCFAVSLWLLVVEKERKESTDDDMDVKSVYKSMWAICQLKNVQSLLFVYFFAKIGWAANEAATQLKMTEKGLAREDLSLAVLIDFPIQIVGGWLAAKWSIGDKPLRPWLLAFWFRFAFAALSMLIIEYFPTPPVGKGFLTVVIVHNVLSSFSGTVQFVGISAFHARIADPSIGGTYMTLLNTVTNLGGTWPRYFVLKGVDYFTVASCKIHDAGGEIVLKAAECTSEHGKAQCKDLNGTCVTEVDGYYWTSSACLVVGVITVLFFITPVAKRLQSLPIKSWRIKSR